MADETETERQRDVIRKLRPGLRLDGKSADWIAGCYDSLTVALLSSRDDSAGSTGSARGVLRFDAADQGGTSGGYRMDYQAPQDGRPVYTARPLRADVKPFNQQPSSAVAQAAYHARRFDKADEMISISAGEARALYLARRREGAA